MTPPETTTRNHDAHALPGKAECVLHLRRALRAPRFTPMARAMLLDLNTAARDGRLTRWEVEFIVSLQRQAARPRWRPSRRQAAVIRRLHAALAEAEATLIDNDDTVDACAATGGRATEFVGR